MEELFKCLAVGLKRWGSLVSSSGGWQVRGLFEAEEMF